MPNKRRLKLRRLRDSNSYRSQMVIAEEARSSRPAPPVGNDRYEQLVQEHAELTHQYAMIRDLLSGCTQRVKEGQQAALLIREQKKTIEALEAQAVEEKKKLAKAEKDVKWALDLWNQHHPPSASPPSPGSPTKPKPPGSPPK